MGGTKAWITSEFAQTQMMTFIVLLYYAFFIAVGAGLTLLRDREEKVDVLLHSTPLTPGEYVWGRYLAVAAGFVVLMLWQIATTAFFNHVVPNAEAVEIRGPFQLMNYLTPVLTMGLPFLIFYAAVSMYVGEKSRSAVLVFVIPVAMLLVCGFFLWTWSPSWLDPRLNKLLQVLEPSGYRWLNETHLKVDRGVAFYNTQRVPYDGLFWLNRLWILIAGIGAIFLTQRSVARSLSGVVASKSARKAALAQQGAAAPSWSEAPSAAALSGLHMKSSTPSYVRGTLAVAGAELHELLRQAGLYIFIPLILIQALGNALLAVGAFDTPILLTPGVSAVGIANQISTLVLLLLLFYTVESLERERSTGLSQILYATPLRTAALLSGKALANSVVGAVVLFASLAASAIAIAVQRTVPFSLEPYLIIWGLLLIPTFFAWTAFVSAVYAVVGNRYAAYSVSLAVLIFSGFRALTRQMSWAGNWPLWGALRWSDLGFFETDRTALIWNRVMILGLAVLFTVLAVRFFGRRGVDAVQTRHRLAPRRLLASTARLFPIRGGAAGGVYRARVSGERGARGGSGEEGQEGLLGQEPQDVDGRAASRHRARRRQAQGGSPEALVGQRRHVHARQSQRRPARPDSAHRRTSLDESHLDAERRRVQARGFPAPLRLHPAEAARDGRQRGDRLALGGAVPGRCHQERREHRGVRPPVGCRPDRIRAELRSRARIHGGRGADQGEPGRAPPLHAGLLEGDDAGRLRGHGVVSRAHRRSRVRRSTRSIRSASARATR